jgi:uncharacterized protein YjbI with pentapeptide repeats
MVNANLSQAKLSGSVAAHTDFTDAVMRRCKLVRADLQHAVMTGADLQGADFSGANLQGASLRNAILTGAIFFDTTTDGADMAGVLTEKPAGRLMSELTPDVPGLLQRHERWVNTNGAEGQPIDLSGFDLRDLRSLAGQCLSTLRARGAIFCGLFLDGVALQAAQLEGADLRSCQLTRADLRGVNLSEARLTNADLRDSNLGPLLLPGGRMLVS